MSKEIVELNKIIEYKNICKKCGAENTLYPYFIGRKIARFCKNCNQVSTGITKSKYMKKITEKLATSIGNYYYNRNHTKKELMKKFNLSLYKINQALDLCLSNNLIERYD